MPTVAEAYASRRSLRTAYCGTRDGARTNTSQPMRISPTATPTAAQRRRRDRIYPITQGSAIRAQMVASRAMDTAHRAQIVVRQEKERGSGACPSLFAVSL